MSQPFTFPPPPPPPPKPLANPDPYQSQNNRGGQRGRGNFSTSQQNSRGGGARGQYHSRGSRRGGYGNRVNGVNYTGSGHQSYNQTYQNTSRHNQTQDRSKNGSFNTAQKRPHSTAFDSQPTTHLAKSRPLAPPAVPSFGINFDALLPRRQEPPKTTATPPLKKANLLGLTPDAQTSDSESEDDNEEESKLANAFANGNALQFEYRGETGLLQTPEDIVLWIAERRKKWPTEAKREIARKEAEEKRRKWETEKAARLEASRAAAKARQEEWQKQKLEREKSQIRQKLLRDQIQKASVKAKALGDNSIQNAAQMKAEKLGRKAQKVAQRLKIAETALVEQGQDTGSVTTAETQAGSADRNDIDALVAQVDRIAAAQQDPTRANGVDLGIDVSNSDINTADEPDPIPRLGANTDVESTIPADDTSTSGSSSEDQDTDTDSSSPPEQLSSKPLHSQPANLPSRLHTSAPLDTRPLCTNYTKTGRCKFGRRCHFRHEKASKNAASHSKESGRRKGLYQVMVEKEQEAERRRALRVIIALGDAGVLDREGDGGEAENDD